MMRRRLLGAVMGFTGTAAAGFLGLSGFPRAAKAAPKASGKGLLNIVVPFPPGGGGDVLARSVTEEWARELGMKALVENRPGAGGVIGTRRVAKAKPGSVVGYVTNGIMCVNRHLYDTMDFDPLEDLVPVGRLSEIGLMMVVNPTAVAGASDWKSLEAYARANPGRINAASSGIGTTSHLAAAFLEAKTGLRFTHVPYKGGAAAILDVLAGRTPFMIDVTPNVLPHVKAGKLKALAVTTAERSQLAPEVPTMEELGFKDFVLTAWDGFVMPKGSDPELVNTYARALAKVLEGEIVRERLAAKGARTVPGTPEDFQAFAASEAPKWKEIVERIKHAKD